MTSTITIGASADRMPRRRTSSFVRDTININNNINIINNININSNSNNIYLHNSKPRNPFRPFRSDEEGESSIENYSNSSNNNNDNDNNNDNEGCDSSSSSSSSSQSQSQSPEESVSVTVTAMHSHYNNSNNNNNDNGNRKRNHSTNMNNNNGNSNSNSNNSNSNSRGNRSDSELESNSRHKRALHESRIPMSVFRGKNKNSGNYIHNNNNNNNNYNHNIHNGTLPEIFRSGSDDLIFQQKRDTSQSSSSSHQPTAEEAAEAGNGVGPLPTQPTAATNNNLNHNNHDDNNHNHNHNHNTHNNHNHNENNSGKSLRAQSRPTTHSKSARDVWWWRLLRKTNLVVLLLVTAFSMLGVGLYTQSYAQLSITLDQVITNTRERRKQVAVRFEDLERTFLTLRKQLMDLDDELQLRLHDNNDDENNNANHGYEENVHSNSHNDASADNKNNNNNNNDDNGHANNNNKHIRSGHKQPNHRGDRNGSSSSVSVRNQEPPPPPPQEPEMTASGLFDEMVAVKEKMRIRSSQISEFERYIRDTSYRDATRKYGRGVIRVRLHLVFLSDELPETGSAKGGVEDSSLSSPLSLSPHFLVLEMAPLEVMPHSVYTFLEMVDAGLIDGCSFVLKAMNVIKAVPLPYDGSPAAEKVRAFTRAGLDTVSFKEYSPEYPHRAFTVGFSADESPDFYINTGDNTERNAGEPCFSRIVSGFETLERMEAEPVRSGMWYKKRIGIQKAIIV